jgi:glycosyltransferase involved in cell wall biosynthesis
MKSDSLFITYDGLLDPLGGSQILPYLKGIAAHPRHLHILSFEKPDRFAQGGQRLMAELAAHRIGWTPLSFSTRAGKLGKLWDLARMYLTAIHLQRQHRFSIIHCRSYQAMQVGCLLKRIAGAKTLFDMRGLWVDERVDGGIWRRDRWLDRLAYQTYKGIEKRLLACADHVIALTERVLPELRRLSPGMTDKLTVIPCCADFDHFEVPTPAQRLAVRAELGVPEDARVIAYLGSLGTWYMLDDMLRLFAQAQTKWSNVHLLLITRDWRAEHDAMVTQMGLASVRDRIHVRPATRTEVPALLGCADVMLSFIKPAYSKMASSPTKLAEAFAVGVPAISNTGIGDVDEMTKALDAGALVDLGNVDSMKNVIAHLDAIAAKGGLALRERSRVSLGLEVAESHYRRVYQELEQAC